MPPEQFNAALETILERVRKDTIALMARAREGNADGMAGSKPVDFADNPQTQRACDTLCEMGAWLHDQLNGRTFSDKRTVTRRVRKALGYTFP